MSRAKPGDEMEMIPESISSPPHYTQGRTIEPWDAFTDWFGAGALLWNACKYLVRVGRKGDKADAIADCRKAIAYIERYMRHLEGAK